jgi:hypothetical protein
VQISNPQQRQVVWERLDLRGRATHEAFAGYTVSYALGALPPSGYQEAFRSETPVEDGLLGVFVLSELPDGVYTLALDVLVSAGDPPAGCRVVIEVRNP